MKGRISRPDLDEQRIGWPRVGSLRIGLKNDRGLPQSVDYFIPVGKYAELFTKAYGPKPSTIQVVFPDDDPAKVCNERYEYRDDDGRLIASGNGDVFEVWNGKGYEPLTVQQYPNLMQSIAKRYPNRQVNSGHDGWSVVLNLNFIIPMVRGVAGVWQFATKGTASTIPQVRTMFDAVLKQRGACKGLVFDLNVQFATSQKPGNKSRFPVVTLVLNESAENVNKIREAFRPIRQIESK